MTKDFFLLFFISCLGYWVFGWFLIPKLRYCHHRALDDKASFEKKKVSLIIPARNEADRLTPLLKSLQAERAFQKHEIILADDGSTDGTAAMASSYGCRVLSVTDKPPEALGKSWACAAGAAGAAGEYLMFLDADVVFLPGGLEAVLKSYSCGLLSVQPYHRFKRFYESFSAYFNLMAVAGVNSFSLHSTGNSAQGAFGPCMVCRKEDYLTLGGHRAVMEELVDDLALARLFRKHGYRIDNYVGKGSVEYRMYPEGPRAVWAGWVKNMASASATSSRLTSLYFGLWCAGVATLLLAFLTAHFAGSAGTGLALTAYFLYALQFSRTLRQLGNWKVTHALLFPFYLLFFLVVLTASVVKTHLFGYADWKGRRIHLKKTSRDSKNGAEGL